jgi:2'-hydroxyisoflavone reductase
MARGGEMIAPYGRTDRMQIIDVRDLGDFIVTVVEGGHKGVYNAVGPSSPELATVLEAVRAGVGSDVRLTWIDQPWLAKNGAGEWKDFPLAVSENDEQSGFAHVNAARAVARGLRFRPLAETAKDTLAWWNAQSEERRAQKRPGISPEREAELLEKWHASQK